MIALESLEGRTQRALLYKALYCILVEVVVEFIEALYEHMYTSVE
jgi:hypothetical protein